MTNFFLATLVILLTTVPASSFRCSPSSSSSPIHQSKSPSAKFSTISASIRTAATSTSHTQRCNTQLSAEAVASPNSDESSSSSSSTALTKQQKRLQQIRKEGGFFAFNTKYGALNPYAIYYGLVSIGLGLVWFVFLTLSQLLYKVTGDRVDKKRRLPVFFSHVWGTLLMVFTGCFPKVENWDIIKEFHKR